MNTISQRSTHCRENGAQLLISWVNVTTSSRCSGIRGNVSYAMDSRLYVPREQSRCLMTRVPAVLPELFWYGQT